MCRARIHSAHLFSFPLTRPHTHSPLLGRNACAPPTLTYNVSFARALALYIQNTFEEEALILRANRKTALRIPVASACRRRAKSLHITVSPPLQHHPLLPLPLSGIHTHKERERERERDDARKSTHILTHTLSTSMRSQAVGV